MKLGIVTGTVVSTVKVEGLTGLTLLVVEEATSSGKTLGKNFMVAVDAVGAGLGDVVITTSGSSSRLTDLTQDRPVDCVVVGIVDYVELNSKYSYRKHPAEE